MAAIVKTPRLRGSCLLLLSFFLSLNTVMPRSEKTTPPDPLPTVAAVTHFSLTRGGLALDVPSVWYAKEFPGKKLYQCTIAPHLVQSDRDPIDVGVRIERTPDYTRAFGWKASEPKVQAISSIMVIGTRPIASMGRNCVVTFTQPNPTQEQILAAIKEARAKMPNGGKGLPAVVLAPTEPAKSISGMESFENDVFTDYESEKCIYHHVVIGIAKKQWLALDFLTTDCNRRELARQIFLNAVASLEISETWPQ